MAQRAVKMTGELAAYCRDVSRVPLLTPEQERTLGERLKKAHDAGREDREARNAMVQANLRFAFQIAKRFTGRGMDLADLVQEGVFGLFRAAEDFDPDRGRFCTHAGHWIKQCITRALDEKSRLIRVPSYQKRLAALYAREEARMQSSGGKMQTQEQLLRKVRVSAMSRSYGHPCVQAILDGLRSLRSICLSLSEEENSCHEPVSREFLAGGQAEQNEQWSAILEVLPRLPVRERQVLEMRCGLCGAGKRDGPLTQREIGERWHCSRDRVRQLEMHALARIREMLGLGESDFSLTRRSRKRRAG